MAHGLFAIPLVHGFRVWHVSNFHARSGHRVEKKEPLFKVSLPC